MENPAASSEDKKEIVSFLKLQLEEAQDHNQLIQDEMIKERVTELQN